MPYIDQKLRTKKTKEDPKNAGQLNWSITMDIRDITDTIGVANYIGVAITNKIKTCNSYQGYNDCIGVAYSCFLEWVRRKDNGYDIYNGMKTINNYITIAYKKYIADYEDIKAQQNGDVY